MINALGKIYSSVTDVLDFNQATLSGCIDVIVADYGDGTYKSTPFHVRFGKLKLLKSKDRVVTVEVNDVKTDFTLKLGSAGEAYFEEATIVREDEVSDLISPAMSEDNLSDPGEYGVEEEEPPIDPKILEKIEEVEKQIQKQETKPDQEPPTDPDAVVKEEIKVELGGEGEEKSHKKGWTWIWSKNEKKKPGQQTAEKSPEDSKAQSKDELPNEPAAKDGKKKLEPLKLDSPSQPTKNEKEKLKEEMKSLVKSEAKKEEVKPGSEKKDKDAQEKDKKPKGKEEKAVPVKKKASSHDVSPRNMQDGKKEKTGLMSSFFGIFRKKEGGHRYSEDNIPIPDDAKLDFMLTTPEKFEFPPRETEDTSVPTFQSQDSALSQKDFFDQLNETNFSIMEDEANSNKKTQPQPPQPLSASKAEQSKGSEGSPYTVDTNSSLKSPDEKTSAKEITTPQPQEQKVELVDQGLMDQENGENDIELSLCKNKIDKADSEDLSEIFLKYRVTYQEYVKDPIKILSNPNLMVRIDDKLYEWKVAVPLIISLLAFRTSLPEKLMDQITLQDQNKSVWNKLFNKSKSPKLEPIQSPPKQTLSSPKSKDGKDSMEQLILDKVKEPEVVLGPVKKTDSQVSGPTSVRKTSDMSESALPKIRYRKFLRPTSEMLKALNLKPGQNKVRYIVQSSFQGSQYVEGCIFLWPTSTKIVISDIDGTITKSDVLGHLMPMVGGDWSHQGVAQLYTNIHKNGYQILYLTARAIGQSLTTRNYLNSVVQGNITLPPGPVIMSPDRLISSFKREVIHKKPEVFKIACLRDIKNVFPPDQNPFYAGFGNRDTDAIAYRAVGIMMGKIFIIDPEGEIQQLNNSYQETYLTINNLVDRMFPQLNPHEAYVPAEEYNEFNFWKPKPKTLTMNELKEYLA